MARLSLLLCLLAASAWYATGAPYKMVCGKSWEGCVDLGGGVTLLALNQNAGGGNAPYSTAVCFSLLFCTVLAGQQPCQQLRPAPFPCPLLPFSS